MRKPRHYVQEGAQEIWGQELWESEDKTPHSSLTHNSQVPQWRSMNKQLAQGSKWKHTKQTQHSIQLTLVSISHSSQGWFPPASQWCGGGSRRARCAGVCPSQGSPRAHHFLEEEQCSCQWQGQQDLCESIAESAMLAQEWWLGCSAAVTSLYPSATRIDWNINQCTCSRPVLHQQWHHCQMQII